jgi:biopolymer transport protein ExbB
MIIMSMGSWYIIFTKLFEQQQAAEERQRRGRLLLEGQLDEAGGTSAARRQRLPLHRRAGRQGRRAPRGHAGRGDRQAHLDQHERGARRGQHQSRLQDGLAFLATVGSTAPFVGLFGTVWGIYHALTAIGISGQASIDKVAGPVGEALIMTAIGLAVAVPAVMGYNWLIRRNKAVMERSAPSRRPAQRAAGRQKVTPPRSAFGASPPGGHRQAARQSRFRGEACSRAMGRDSWR